MSSPTYPLHPGTPEAFATVRNYLRDAGFTDQFLLSHFRIPRLHPLLYSIGIQGQYFEERYKEPGLAVQLARLFVAGHLLTAEEMSSHFPETFLAACRELGLIESVDGGWQCPVVLVPAMGLYLTADRGARPGKNVYEGADYVMSGVESVCWDYVSNVSVAPCRSFLDMGTGSGFAAMRGAQCATHSWGVDITPRAAQCAEFNRLLNGFENLTILQGDLFAPVAGMTFDRIACNPPFEPPLKRKVIFSIGGADGEAIIQRFVSEVPRYLEPGGRVYSLVLGTDREGEDFHERIHKWLGDAVHECDVALFISLTMKPSEYGIQQILGDNQDSWKLQEWNMFYYKLKARSVVMGHLVIQKRSSDRPVFFTRRDFGPNTGLAEIEWLMRWETFAKEPGFEAAFLAAVPTPGPAWELQVRHAMEGGALRPRSYKFLTKYPFEVELETPAWMGMLAGSVDGKTSFGSMCDSFQSKMGLPREEFLRGATALVSADVMRVEGYHPAGPLSTAPSTSTEPRP